MRALPRVVTFGSVVLCAVALAAPVSAQSFGLIAPGTELRLVLHDVEVRIAHPVAETLITQEFENRSPVNLEATFHYPVPVGATVTGMALWVNGVRREARMLERQKAREIYDGIVAQRRDPALVERLDGSTFRIRIFPVLARSRTRVELRLAQLVEKEQGGLYSFTLKRPPGAPLHVLRLGVRLSSSVPLLAASLKGYPAELRPAGQSLTLPRSAAQHSFESDIELRYQLRPSAAVGPTVVKGDQRIFVAEVPISAASARPGKRLALLLDSSRTIEPHLPLLRSVATELLAKLSAQDRVALVPFDLLPRRAAVLRTLDDSGRRETAAALAGLAARGGTAFAPAFLAALQSGADHIICVTDGGSRFHQEELEHVHRLLFDHPGVRVSTVTLPGAANTESLADLATTAGGVHLPLGAGSDLGPLIQRLVSLPSLERVALEGRSPLQVLLRQPDRLVVAGSVPLAESPRALALSLSSSGRSVELAGEELPDLAAVPALWAAAAIDERLRRIKLFGETPALREEVVRLSVEHHVISEYTALLATETDADYDRSTSGRVWQRTPARIGDTLPSASFQSSPEPHEWALILLGMALLLLARSRRFSPFSSAR